MPSPSRRKPAAQSALAGFDNQIVMERAAAMTVRARRDTTIKPAAFMKHVRVREPRSI